MQDERFVEYKYWHNKIWKYGMNDDHKKTAKMSEYNKPV